MKDATIVRGWPRPNAAPLDDDELGRMLRTQDRSMQSMRVGFVAIIDRAATVISLVLEPLDALPLAAPLAGQFIVLRMLPAHATSPLMRSNLSIRRLSARSARMPG